jgi:hypothetical protein
MRFSRFYSLLLLLAFVAAGCRTYEYQILEPPNLSQTISKQPVVVHYDPLDYRFARRQGYLGMRIINPTDDRIILVGDRSYVVDPNGQSHPIRGRVIGPHSFTEMLLPQTPQTYQQVIPYPYYGYGLWPTYLYPPLYGGFYDEFYYGPPVVNYQVITPYNWDWKTGPAQFLFSYDQQGKVFDHHFVIERRVAQ